MKKIVGILIVLLLLTGCAGNIKDGVALMEEGKYESAMEAFKKDVKRGRNLDEAYRGLGIACFEMEDYESAVEAFEKAVQHNTKETGVLCSMMGAGYLQIEEYEKSLDAYERALSCEDLTEELRQEIQFNLIAVYEYMGNWEAAKKQMDQYVKMYPEDIRVEKEAEFLETR